MKYRYDLRIHQNEGKIDTAIIIVSLTNISNNPIHCRNNLIYPRDFNIVFKYVHLNRHEILYLHRYSLDPAEFNDYSFLHPGKSVNCEIKWINYFNIPKYNKIYIVSRLNLNVIKGRKTMLEAFSNTLELSFYNECYKVNRSIAGNIIFSNAELRSLR